MSKMLIICGCALASAFGAGVLGTSDVNSDGCVDLRDYAELQTVLTGPCEHRKQVMWRTTIEGEGLKVLANPRRGDGLSFFVTDIWSTGSTSFQLFLPREFRADTMTSRRTLLRIPPGMFRLPRPIPVQSAIELGPDIVVAEPYHLVLVGYYDQTPEIVWID